VATLNRRLAAAGFAQVASFAVVLAVGAVGGGSPSPAHRFNLTITVVAQGGASAGGALTGKRSASSTPALSGKSSPFGGRPVWILRIGSNVRVESGLLRAAGKPVTSVPKGPSLVCVSPPGGLRHIGPAVAGPAAWICSLAGAATGSAVAASGSLDSAGKLVRSLPEGSYLACVSPSTGWRSANAAVVKLPGWICKHAKIGKGPQTVVIQLTRQAAIPGGSGP